MNHAEWSAIMAAQIARLRNLADNASDPEVQATLRDIVKKLEAEQEFVDRNTARRVGGDPRRRRCRSPTAESLRKINIRKDVRTLPKGKSPWMFWWGFAERDCST